MVNIAEQKTSASFACRIGLYKYWSKILDTYASCIRPTIYKKTGMTHNSTTANCIRRSPMASISSRRNIIVPNYRQELLCKATRPSSSNTLAPRIM
ncbi:hypothetical protein DPMN_119439 [Dreissena polymorpha]|uniref:Uncharacterized protein n=1 Tax=Dreissena polymorpha TaxID=45954 RepID=A0A9D4GJ85_DREPO|nr:hypothetical protein DPMN_119439 [Dreissena polymorpha]